MGRVLSRAIEAAGLGPCRTRVLAGASLTKQELAQLRAADLLLVAGLADEKRAQFHGDDVRIVTRTNVRDAKPEVGSRGAADAGGAGLFEAGDRGFPVTQSAGSATAAVTNVVVFDHTPSELGATGADVLRELALLRLATSPEQSIAVSIDALGLELAQTALLFGADMLFGELEGKRTLPLLDGPAARRVEIEGLVARSGRRAHFIDAVELREPQEQHA